MKKVKLRKNLDFHLVPGLAPEGGENPPSTLLNEDWCTIDLPSFAVVVIEVHYQGQIPLLNSTIDLALARVSVPLPKGDQIHIPVLKAPMGQFNRQHLSDHFLKNTGFKVLCWAVQNPVERVCEKSSIHFESVGHVHLSLFDVYNLTGPGIVRNPKCIEK